MNAFTFEISLSAGECPFSEEKSCRLREPQQVHFDYHSSPECPEVKKISIIEISPSILELLVGNCAKPSEAAHRISEHRWPDPSRLVGANDARGVPEEVCSGRLSISVRI